MGLVALRFFDQSEPCYQNKKLSDWLKLQHSANQVEAISAQNAIRTIGTNGVPTLVRLIAYNPEQDMNFRISELLPLRFRATAIFNRLQSAEMRKNYLALEAIEAIGLLGTNGIPAIPELTKTAMGTNRFPAMRAINALKNLGEPGTAALGNIATVTNYPQSSIDNQRIHWVRTNSVPK